MRSLIFGTSWQNLRLEFTRVVNVQDVAVELGLSPETPLLGYVLKKIGLQNRDLAEGLSAASKEAKRILAADDNAWEPSKS